MEKIKKATTIDEQIEILKSRNLIIENEQRAKEILYSVNYYNFTGYLYTYKDVRGHYNNITFDKAYRIYLCDKRMRAIILYAIEIVEHNLKTKIAYTMAHMLGELSYLDENNFTDETEYTRLMEHFNQAIKRNQKIPFVKHHIKKYESKFPVWVAIELFTLGMVWNCFRYLNKPVKKEISNGFHVGAFYLESWIECISYLRNICAHYMRLYRFNIQKTPKQSKYHSKYTASNRIYDIINILRFLMPNTGEWKEYIVPTLLNIFEEYSDVIAPIDYGFPADWEKELKK